MFERRLYFHVDWLLLGAVLLLAAIGVAMIYSTTYVHAADGTGHAGAALLGSALRRRPRPAGARSSSSPLDYRFLAEHSLFLYGGLVLLLVYVLVEGRQGRRVAALDFARALQPAAIGVRPRRARADPGDVSSARTAAARGTTATS